ncbi:MAG TPA: DUF5996 family protein [Xanthobacteraceae bacterium]|nr:DUF5996 family protein [Xanthobacteraceae bacterium]
MSHPAGSGTKSWPRMAYSDWSDTCATLHLWTQIVGKARLVLAPMQNHGQWRFRPCGI